METERTNDQGVREGLSQKTGHLKKSNGMRRRSWDPHTDVRSGGGRAKEENRVHKRTELPGEPQVI